MERGKKGETRSREDPRDNPASHSRMPSPSLRSPAVALFRCPSELRLWQRYTNGRNCRRRRRTKNTDLRVVRNVVARDAVAITFITSEFTWSVTRKR